MSVVKRIHTRKRADIGTYRYGTVFGISLGF